MRAVLGSFLHELSCYQSQHVLATTQQSLPRGIIDTSLRLVEALKSILLASSSIASVRLEKRGVEKS
jgi:hypothetical protein